MTAQRSLLGLLALALLIRLASLGAYPLMDTTESRYGEMARIMVETGNWLTPMFDYDVPFWGKPPLHTWMSAAGQVLLGENEFALRLPHWLAGLGVMALVWGAARRQGQPGVMAALVLASCALFAVASGAVMTDMALTLGMTLAMLGFYRCWQGERSWGYLGFVGLAIGLLAKGPVIIVIMGLAVVPWVLWQHRLGCLKQLWLRVPLLSGLALMLALAAPWYILAEQATPGFLDYFLVGEHFNRFVVSGWEGDLYGSAHDQPRGMIWLYWLLGALPWSAVLPWLLWQRYREGALRLSPWQGLLLGWMVAPMVLFTLAGNILPAYVLPGVPALALLVVSLVRGEDTRLVQGASLVVPVVLVGALWHIQGDVAEAKSDKWLLSQRTEALPLVYWHKRTFSGRYYSQGQAELVTEGTMLPQDSPYYLVGQPYRMRSLSLADCELLAKSRKRGLWRCGPGAER